MSKRENKKASIRKRKAAGENGQNHPASFNTTLFDLQAALNQASLLFSLGRLAEAESLCKRILEVKPENIPTLYGLGRIAHQTGRLAEAAQYIAKITRLLPDNHEAYNYLGIILKDLGKPNEAEQTYLKAIELNPLFAECHNNLGNLYFSQKKFDLAIASYQHAIKINPVYVNAHFNLANAYQANKLFDESIVSYIKTISLQPDHADTLKNLSLLLRRLDRPEEALEFLLIAANNYPENNIISNLLIELLDKYTPITESDSPYIKAHHYLQQVIIEYSTTQMIADETVMQIYRKLHRIFSLHKLEIKSMSSQIFRGATFDINCHRHKRVFNTFGVIPRYCFGCYKVMIEPGNVMELFKLLLVFNKLKLPGNNTRKCMVETRPGIPGTYKGFVYCKSLEESKEILNIIQPIIKETISRDIPILVKRGCSEFQIAYPPYGLAADNNSQCMTYKEEWREHEAFADKNMFQLEDEAPDNFTHNHAEFTLLDVVIMRNWLAYAAKIGDSSYLKIIEPTPLMSRP